VADETQEDIISIVATLERRIKEETRSVGILYRGYDSNLLSYVTDLEARISKNCQGVAELLELTKFNLQNIEFKRRMVGVNMPNMREPMNSMWSDPDRGSFMPVDKLLY
jgi:hypothetical protein